MLDARAKSGVVAEGLTQQVKKAPAEVTSKDAPRKKEFLVAGAQPAATVEREAAGRNDAVYVRVKSEGLPPGVQNGQHADECSEASAVAGDDQQRLAYSSEQDVVEPAWIPQSECVEQLRNGEDDMEVRYGKKLAFALFEPLLASLGLTARTMPVPARVPDHVTKAAVVALIEMSAQGRGATERDGAQSTTLRARQTMTLLIPRADPTDDLAERDAGRHDGHLSAATW